MGDEKKFEIGFNRILIEEMAKNFELNPLPLAPEFKLNYSDDKSVCIKSEYSACPKTGGIRSGELDLKGAMTIHFGNVPPGKDYNQPILGYTFVYANKCLIVVLDLLPISKDPQYMNKFIAPLEKVSQKYAGIPRVEGGRSEVAEWAKIFDSGFSIYLWCDGQYIPDMEDAFRDYLRVLCDCINKAERLTDPQLISQRDKHVEKYISVYLENDVGGAPLKSHFGKDWGVRYMRDFFFAP